MSAHFFIEFIKRVEEKRKIARFAEHFISFFTTSLINNNAQAQIVDSDYHMPLVLL